MYKKEIKSFVLRAGRMTVRQQKGYVEDLKHYALTSEHVPWCFSELFGVPHTVIVEIGFGMGDSLLDMAQHDPHTHYIGMEVHRAGIGQLAANLKEKGLTNVRIVTEDACDIFERAIPDQSLTGIQIFFPDPWPKKKHHKRRLIQAPFVTRMIAKLKPHGFIHCATDWAPYAEHMSEVFAKFHPVLQPSGVTRPRPETKFERRGLSLGHDIVDLVYHKT